MIRKKLKLDEKKSRHEKKNSRQHRLRRCSYDVNVELFSLVHLSIEPRTSNTIHPPTAADRSIPSQPHPVPRPKKPPTLALMPKHKNSKMKTSTLLNTSTKQRKSCNQYQ